MKLLRHLTATAFLSQKKSYTPKVGQCVKTHRLLILGDPWTLVYTEQFVAVDAIIINIIVTFFIIFFSIKIYSFSLQYKENCMYVIIFETRVIFFFSFLFFFLFCECRSVSTCLPVLLFSNDWRILKNSKTMKNCYSGNN